MRHIRSTFNNKHIPGHVIVFTDLTWIKIDEAKTILAFKTDIERRKTKPNEKSKDTI